MNIPTFQSTRHELHDFVSAKPLPGLWQVYRGRISPENLPEKLQKERGYHRLPGALMLFSFGFLQINLPGFKCETCNISNRTPT
jgi:hypothetical protein